MSTASAQKCTIVPPDYSGQIPGTYVGQIWKVRPPVPLLRQHCMRSLSLNRLSPAVVQYRGEAHSAGVHRGMVAGIAGNLSMGKVVSIVMAGGYEDDDDQGDEFVYTGSGGIVRRVFVLVLSRSSCVLTSLSLSVALQAAT